MNDLYVHQLETENKQLREALQQTRKVLEEQRKIINEALHKLNASKNHFKTQRENNAVSFTIKILKGERLNEYRIR